MTGAAKNERAEIVKSGTWTYDEFIEQEVWIVRQNFEYHFEEEYDDAERLNEDGESFKILYAQDRVLTADGPECLSLEEAILAAEYAIPQGINWDNHRIQPLFGGRHYRSAE